MTTIRYAVFILAALSLITLSQTPNSPATIILAGLFAASFAALCWTCREPKTRRR